MSNSNRKMFRFNKYLCGLLVVLAVPSASKNHQEITPGTPMDSWLSEATSWDRWRAIRGVQNASDAITHWRSQSLNEEIEYGHWRDRWLEVARTGNVWPDVRAIALENALSIEEITKLTTEVGPLDSWMKDVPLAVSLVALRHADVIATPEKAASVLSLALHSGARLQRMTALSVLVESPLPPPLKTVAIAETQTLRQEIENPKTPPEHRILAHLLLQKLNIEHPVPQEVKDLMER